MSAPATPGKPDTLEVHEARRKRALKMIDNESHLEIGGYDLFGDLLERINNTDTPMYVQEALYEATSVLEACPPARSHEARAAVCALRLARIVVQVMEMIEAAQGAAVARVHETHELVDAAELADLKKHAAIGVDYLEQVKQCERDIAEADAKLRAEGIEPGDRDLVLVDRAVLAKLQARHDNAPPKSRKLRLVPKSKRAPKSGGRRAA